MHVFFDGCVDDILDRAVVPEVDDLSAFALENSSHNIDRCVVPVKQTRSRHHSDGILYLIARVHDSLLPEVLRYYRFLRHIAPLDICIVNTVMGCMRRFLTLILVAAATIIAGQWWVYDGDLAEMLDPGHVPEMSTTD